MEACVPAAVLLSLDGWALRFRALVGGSVAVCPLACVAAVEREGVREGGVGKCRGVVGWLLRGTTVVVPVGQQISA